MPPGQERAEWTEDIVSNVNGSEFAIRNYLEQAAVRDFMRREVSRLPIRVALDFGAGYGRMTPVLCEFTDDVVAVEREEALVQKGAYLQPRVRFMAVPGLDHVGLPDSYCQFALVFNVMQHLTDDQTRRALTELSRVVTVPGTVLMCEDTEAGYVHDDPSIPGSTFTVGRSVAAYQQLLPGFELVHCSPRAVERSEHRDVGTYMLFRR